MAEKTRRKEPEEPAAENRRAAPKTAAASANPGRERKPAAAPPRSLELADEAGILESPALPSAQELAERLLDRKTLNFDKYELPKRKPAAPKKPVKPAETPPEPAAFEETGAVFEPAPPASAAVVEYSFESFDEPEASAPLPQAVESRPAPPLVRSPRRARNKTAPKPHEEEKHGEPADIAEERQREREDFMRRLSSDFEQEFNEKFERTPEKKTPPAPVRQPPVPEAFSAFGEMITPKSVKTPAPEPALVRPQAPKEPVFSPEQDESDGFIAQFAEDVKQEEAKRAEDFKETLAQKFMRERERYLKELGADTAEEEAVIEEPESGPLLPPRRKLDFKIQPEMHREESALPQPQITGPATYTRTAGLKPLTPQPEEDPAPALSAPGAGKKTSEQLLLELARAQARLSRPAPPPQKPAAPNPRPEAPAPPPAPKDKPAKRRRILPEGKWPRRIALLLSVSAVLSAALLVGALWRYTQLDNLVTPPESASPQEPVQQSMLEVYESKSFNQRATVDNVIFKKPDATLKNVSVREYVVIDAIVPEGSIRLEDMTVDAAVSVKNCGINALELHNVHAGRVIINNPSKNMTITASGDTDVGVIEIRTPATVRQTSLTNDSPGTRTLTVTEESVNITLDGLSLETLAVASGTVTAFENNTRADFMTADGSLSLTGSGKVTSLAAGSKVGQGAGDMQNPPLVNMIIKGVEIGSFHLKSPANVNLAANVDSIATSDFVSLVGNGAIGMLTLNPRFGTSRLLADIADLTVQNVYVNTPARINATGMARINTLVADASVYALGNRVNLLVVNADGVIYENEPDKIETASGINPPQTKAENPNIDYNLGSNSGLLDATGDDLATTCGHPRDSGGFLIGDGSRDAPFEVSSPVQLAHISSHLASHFMQTADIDIGGDSRYSGGFPMIASDGTPFTGVYGGGGFSITNLRIISSGENVGLFAENKGIIENVRLVSGDIAANREDRAFAGGIAGLNYEGGIVRSCSNGAAVSGNQNHYVGGIAGYNFGAKVHECYNYAKISGVDVVGGLVGMNRQRATLTGSYNVGTVTGRNDTGAVAGKNEDATIANCYYLLETADAGIGTGGGTAIEKTSEELAQAQMAADLAAGNEDSLWIPGETAANGYHYPVHRR